MPARREADIPMSSAAIFALLLIAYPACALAEAPKTCAAPPTSTLTVDVKDKGAKGDGKTDDTAAIQSAIDDVAGANGTVFVPDGIYMVDAVRGKSLRLGSDMTLKLADNAVLNAFPNKSKKLRRPHHRRGFQCLGDRRHARGRARPAQGQVR